MELTNFKLVVIRNNLRDTYYYDSERDLREDLQNFLYCENTAVEVWINNELKDTIISK